MSTDDLVAAYPQLTLADVHAALAFYFDHRDEIESQMQEDSEFVSAMKARQTSNPAPVSLRKEADADSVSP